LENSQDLKTFLESSFAYQVGTGFGFSFVLGLIKYVCLVTGIVILAAVLCYQIKRKWYTD
jgi:hypothetical protein